MYEVLRETYAHADLAPDVLRKGAISKNGQTERMGGRRSKTASRKSDGIKSNESNLISVVGTLNSQLIACKEGHNSVNNLREDEEQKYMQLKASYVECTITVWYQYPESACNNILCPNTGFQ